MKVICIEKPGEIHLQERSKPIVDNPQTALIKVISCGICGSDVAAFKYNHPNCNYPLVIGHEIAGIIEEIADNAQGLKKGDRVVLDPYMYCGDCYPCSQGRTNCCEHLQCLGVQTDGAMAEYFVHPINQLVKFSDDIPWAYAPLSEPLTIALHAIHRTAPKPGEHVTVIGAGAIGIMAALVAEIYGAIPILVDVLDGRLKVAEEFGIKNLINPATQNAEEIISSLTNGRMSEVVIEASGANAGVQNTLQYSAYTGRVALTGWPKNEVNLQTGLITKKELQILGSRTSVNEFEEALDLIANKKIDIAKFASKVVPFDEIPEAVKLLAEDASEYLKIVGMHKDYLNL